MQKRAFTLIELLLVVVIMGVVYALVVGAMQRINDKEYKLSFLSLASFLEDFHQQNEVSLVCIDNCRHCGLYVDGAKTADVNAFMRDERQLDFWSYDANYGSRPLTFKPLFDEDGREFDVCFAYTFFPDGSQSEMIVETRNKVYDYRGALRTVSQYESIDTLIEDRNKEIERVLQ